MYKIGLSGTSRSLPPLPWRMDDDAFLVDVLRPEMAQFGASHAGGVERHEDGAVAQIGGGLDEAGHFVGAQHDGICRRNNLGSGKSSREKLRLRIFRKRKRKRTSPL